MTPKDQALDAERGLRVRCRQDRLDRMGTRTARVHQMGTGGGGVAMTGELGYLGAGLDSV
jgi:hypothetical protein